MTVLDSRVWIAWAIAASFPVLVSRSPPLLAVLAAAVVIVRTTCATGSTSRHWRWLVRATLLVAPIGVVFNILTVREGDQILLTLPVTWPIVGGPITANALAYGLVSALAMVTLVLIGTTAATFIDWAALARMMPDRLAPIAVAGSVAWTFLPQASLAFVEIREAQLARGHRLRSLRDAVPILVPLLASSLERALATAEALEARGFGASRQSGRVPRRTRYRDIRLARVDKAVLALIALSIATVVGAVVLDGATLRFNPFPRLTVPQVPVVAIIGVAFLIAPAVATAVTPQPRPSS